MSLFLLILGAAVAAVGFVLGAAGAILPVGTFGVEVVTPGAIAAVGGLVLVGMGLTVRQFQRIEHALAAGRGPRAAVPNEAPASFAAKPSAIMARLPFPPKVPSGLTPPPLPPAANPIPEPAEIAAFEPPPIRLAAIMPSQSAPVIGEVEPSWIPPEVAQTDEVFHEVKEVAAIGRGGNGVRPIRTAPRVVANGRQSVAPDLARGAVLNAFWPEKSKAGIQPASAEVAASAPQPPPLPPTVAPVADVTSAPATATPISILKSGVVEGMAYTLYSDGSIEAQLPQGTLRFGSIAALRNHLEGGA